MPKLELDLTKIYTLPENVCFEEIDDKYLAISPDTANWILLNNSSQLKIYKFLASKRSIKDLIKNFPENSIKDIMYVLTELEAKKFELKNVNHLPQHGMYIYLTNKCNQRCVHCYMYAGKENENELSTDEIKNVLFDFANSGGKVVTFTGGEATTRVDFIEIVQFAKKQGLMVGVLSNGVLWTKRLINDVKNYIDEIQISIDGYDSNSYMNVRGTDSFCIVLNTIDELIKNNMRVTVAITPIISTLFGNEEKYILFAKRLLEKYREKEFFVKFNTELMNGREIQPTIHENLKYKECITEIKKACSSNSMEEDFALDHRYNTVFDNCGYGGITIASNGDVFFCNLISNCIRQANVRNDSFEKINELSKKAQKLSNINNLLPCKNCSIKYLCGGGCRVKYFKSLTSMKISLDCNEEMYRTTTCNKEYKDKILRLMVRANKFFYI